MRRPKTDNLDWGVKIDVGVGGGVNFRGSFFTILGDSYLSRWHKYRPGLSQSPPCAYSSFFVIYLQYWGTVFLNVLAPCIQVFWAEIFSGCRWWVSACAQCRLENVASSDHTTEMCSFQPYDPFDKVCLDLCSPDKLNDPHDVSNDIFPMFQMTSFSIWGISNQDSYLKHPQTSFPCLWLIAFLKWLSYMRFYT